MGPKKQKTDAGDVIFVILLVIMLLFLIPFYKSILDIFILSAQLMVGTNTYLGLLGLVFSLFVMFLCFKHNSGIGKVFSLILAFVFLLAPFMDFFNEISYFKQTFTDYHFKGIRVIQPDECEVAQKVQNQMIEKLENEYGGDLEMEPEKIVPKDTSTKEKIKCMPSKTHYAYLIEYTDSYGEKRTVVYDGRDNLDKSLKAQSYDVLYSYMNSYFEQKISNRKTDFQFYIYTKANGLEKLDRSNIVTERVEIPYPTELNLENFNQDKRFVLDVTFALVINSSEIHSIIEELDHKTPNPLSVVVHKGSTSEYYVGGNWTSSESNFLKQIEGA